jgi:hypothetical protein
VPLPPAQAAALGACVPLGQSTFPVPAVEAVTVFGTQGPMVNVVPQTPIPNPAFGLP